MYDSGPCSPSVTVVFRKSWRRAGHLLFEACFPVSDQQAEIVAQARQLRADAVQMLQQAQAGQSPLPGCGAEAACDILAANIAAYDDLIRRHEGSES